MHFDTFAIQTSDGLKLQADLAVPERCAGAAVICHPHPLYGGDRYNPVVDTVMRALSGAGLACIRFDFRGVNDSEGTHGDGIDERLDALAALDAVATHAAGGPILMCGYSFGALVALNTVDPRVSAWFAVAPPLAMAATVPLCAADSRPKRLAVPAHDQYSPPAAVREHSQSWPACEVVAIDMADHFLAGFTYRAGELAVEFLSALAGR